MPGSGSGDRAGGVLKRLGLLGFVAYGLVHAVIGVLAIQLALGGGGEASTSGAMAALGQQPLGELVLWLVAAGMVVLTVWQLVEAVVGVEAEQSADRLKAAGRTVAYGTVAAIAVRFAAADGSATSGDSAETAATTLFTVPGGRLLVAAVGVGALVLGGYNLVKGVTDRFLEHVDRGDLAGRTRRVVTWAGRIGFPARGISYGGVGVLFLVAAWQGDSQEAGGLDQSLATLRDQPFGEVLLLAVGVGFALFAVYCAAVARRARAPQG